MNKVRRWHFWDCFQGDDREEAAESEIYALKCAGYAAKIWAPLPQHKTSGHTHVVVLCTTNELLRLAGLGKYVKEVKR